MKLTNLRATWYSNEPLKSNELRYIMPHIFNISNLFYILDVHLISREIGHLHSFSFGNQLPGNIEALIK